MPTDDADAHPHRPHARLPRHQPRRSALSSSTPSWRRHQATVRVDPRAALLPAAAGGLRQRRRRAAGQPGRRRGPPQRLRLHRRPAHREAAVRELTRGLTRSSRLMQQMLPLLLGWLSESPDPDLGLLQRAQPASAEPQRADELARGVPGVARGGPRLCLLVGTSRLVGRDAAAQRRPGRPPARPRAAPAPGPKAELVEQARLAVSWRDERRRPPAGALQRWKDRHLLGVMARDVLHGAADVATVGADITVARRGEPRGRARDARAEACRSPSSPSAASAAASSPTPATSTSSSSSTAPTPTDFEEATRGWPSACGASSTAPRRPSASGRSTSTSDPRASRAPSPARSRATATYFHRWALVWERQAMARARPVAGDPDVAARFMALLDDFVWEPAAVGRRRPRDPPHEGPHRARAHPDRRGPGRSTSSSAGARCRTSSGRRSCSSCAAACGRPATMGALERLVAARTCSTPADADVLAEAYRFCERTRNRLYLVRSRPGQLAAAASRTSCCGWPARSTRRRPSSASSTGGSPAGPAR